MDILRNMRHIFKSKLMSATTSEKPSLEFYDVFMKVKNDKSVEVKASFVDKETFMTVGDDVLPTVKTTRAEMETSESWK